MKFYKFFKRCSLGLISITILQSTPVFATTLYQFNQETSTINEKSTATYYFWKINSKGTPYTITKGSDILIYHGSPATKDGEYDTISFSKAYSHEMEGSIQVSKSTVSASVGYSIGESVAFSNSRNSAPLKKGQYVKGYIKRTYQRTPIYQRRYLYDLGIETPTSTTATGYADRAILPQITLQYFNPSRGDEIFFKEEILEFIDGEYQVISEIIYE